jgi:hypothetical protein
MSHDMIITFPDEVYAELLAEKARTGYAMAAIIREQVAKRYGPGKETADQSLQPDTAQLIAELERLTTVTQAERALRAIEELAARLAEGYKVVPPGYRIMPDTPEAAELAEPESPAAERGEWKGTSGATNVTSSFRPIW